MEMMARKKVKRRVTEVRSAEVRSPLAEVHGQVPATEVRSTAEVHSDCTAEVHSRSA